MMGRVPSGPALPQRIDEDGVFGKDRRNPRHPLKHSFNLEDWASWQSRQRMVRLVEATSSGFSLAHFPTSDVQRSPASTALASIHEDGTLRH